MNDKPKQPPAASRLAQLGWIVFEALLVAVAGAAVAFGANAISPRGLSLTRNYFPSTTNNVVAGPALSVVAGLREQGLQWMHGAEARRLFDDARFQQQLIVFIDARDEANYLEGHIPGAYEFDPYYPAKQLGAVLPACLNAERIVVYCNGGDCEDSQFAALTLRDAGIPNERLSVFVGGLESWMTYGWPVEVGGRNSGNIRQTKP